MALSEEYDTVVIGAGIAGLYAAHLLQERHGEKIIVLEAKDRIGGRMVSEEIPCRGGKKDTWDFGGQWAGSKQHHLLQALKDLGLETYPQYNTGTKKLMLRDPSDVRSYDGLIPRLGPLELLDLDNMFSEIDKLAASINLDDVLSHPNAVEWDSMTLHTLVTQRARYEVTRDIMEAVIRTVLGADLAQLSVLYFLHYCKQGGTFQALLDTENGGAQEFRVKGSMFQLCQRVGAKLKNLVLNEPVISVDQTNQNEIIVTAKSGKTYKCQHVVMAIPPQQVNNVEFSPSLPYDRVRLGHNMPIGHLIKFIITYETAFWKEKGCSGETVVTGEPGSIGPSTCTFDATTSSGNPAIVGFICADHATYWTRKTKKEREVAVLKSLSAMLGEECLNPICYAEKDWANESYIGGCPVGVMRPKGMLYFHHALRRPFDRVHWAGTETARAWIGYIDGAIESAKRAVTEITEDKSSAEVWKESPVFRYKKKYVSAYQRSCTWSLLKVSTIVALVSALGWYAWKKYEST